MIERERKSSSSRNHIKFVGGTVKFYLFSYKFFLLKILKRGTQGVIIGIWTFSITVSIFCWCSLVSKSAKFGQGNCKSKYSLLEASTAKFIEFYSCKISVLEILHFQDKKQFYILSWYHWNLSSLAIAKLIMEILYSRETVLDRVRLLWDSPNPNIPRINSPPSSSLPLPLLSPLSTKKMGWRGGQLFWKIHPCWDTEPSLTWTCATAVRSLQFMKLSMQLMQTYWSVSSGYYPRHLSSMVTWLPPFGYHDKDFMSTRAWANKFKKSMKIHEEKIAEKI